MRAARVFELAASPVFGPACAGTEVELVFGRAPAAGADGCEVDDLVPVTGSRLLHYLYAVMLAGIGSDLM